MPRPFRLFFFVATLVGMTKSFGAEDPMGCVTELSMPSLNGSAHSFPFKVVARISIGKGGLAKEVDYGDLKAGLFRSELDESFKNETRYAESCDGKTISFTVRYLVEGQTTSHPVWAVRFKPPDEIIVITHPMPPPTDPIRVKGNNTLPDLVKKNSPRP